MEAAQREGRVHLGRMRHERHHAFGTAAREHDARLSAQLLEDPVEKTIHARDLAKYHAGLHGLARGAPDCRLWRVQLNHGQAGRSASKRLRPKRKPRRDDAAEKDLLGIDVEINV